MLRHRLVFGVIMAALMVGVLVVDDRIGKPYPFLLLVTLLVGGLATRELLALLPAEERPRSNLTVLAVMGILLANWWPMVREATSRFLPEFVSTSQPCVCIFFAMFLVAFLWEMAVYQGPDGAIRRIAWTLFITSYIGLLPSSLVQIRFLPGLPSTLVLAAAIAIPKVCDIGAYTFGRLFGRTPFTPILSPKKTWEGFAGGMATAVGVSILFHNFGPVFRLGLPHAIGFGLAVGLAGVLGDLAESMIKREVAAKDASAIIPGFGGILDVIDSVIFAAPVAYLILSI